VSEQSRPDFSLEWGLASQGCRAIAGVDEVGRGSWAGPLVAAAVVLPIEPFPATRDEFRFIRDSKELTPAQRAVAMDAIQSIALGVGIGWATSSEIDRIGLTAANRRAMERAVFRLRTPADGLVIDHVVLKECRLLQISIPRAESQSLSVAAASIVAKLMRDRLMSTWDSLCPGYDFARHKGYGTAGHREALLRLGPSRLHRHSFAPVADWKTL
jgi:ribonuclease HII